MEAIAWDTFQEIAQYLRRRDHKALRRTCKRFSRLPLKALMNGSIWAILPTKGRILQFLDALEEYDSPSLHEVVVSIVIQFAKRKLYHVVYEIEAECILFTSSNSETRLAFDVHFFIWKDGTCVHGCGKKYRGLCYKDAMREVIDEL